MFRSASGHRRWLLLPAITFLLVGVIVGPVAGNASAATLPPEGIFEGCPLDTQMPTCIQRLQVIRQGGFQIVVISAKSGSLSSLQAYAASAQSLGVSIMWELGDSQWWQDSPTSTSASSYYGDFAASCGCYQNGPLLAYVVHWLSQLPATYGYYAADDSALAPGDTAEVANYVAQIKQQDPVHTVMIGTAEESQTATYQPIPDVIGTEIYPVTTDPLMPVSANQDEWDSVGQWAADAQQSANRASKQSAFILQAFSWGDNLSDGQTVGVCSPSDTQLSCYAKLRYPSSAEQLQLRNEVLLHAHPKLILWWSFSGTYGSVWGNGYSIYPSGAAAAADWAGLSAAVQAPFPGASTPAAASPTRESRRLGAHIARAVTITRRRALRGVHRRRHRRHRRHRHKRR